MKIKTISPSHCKLRELISSSIYLAMITESMQQHLIFNTFQSQVRLEQGGEEHIQEKNSTQMRVVLV